MCSLGERTDVQNSDLLGNKAGSAYVMVEQALEFFHPRSVDWSRCTLSPGEELWSSSGAQIFPEPINQPRYVSPSSAGDHWLEQHPRPSVSLPKFGSSSSDEARHSSDEPGSGAGSSPEGGNPALRGGVVPPRISGASQECGQDLLKATTMQMATMVLLKSKSARNRSSVSVASKGTSSKVSDSHASSEESEPQV